MRAMNDWSDMIKCYTQPLVGDRWLQRYQHTCPTIACVLGFTATGLIPGISAAGATPHDRQFTALADAEFLWHGVQPSPVYPLPPLMAGVSPAVIAHAVIRALHMPLHLFNAGLCFPPPVPCVELGGTPAACVTTGQALSLDTVTHLVRQGLHWGQKLAHTASSSYLVLGECVVGGTTTALAVLTGLGVQANGRVNSSHPHCNHRQKQEIVQQGLTKAGLGAGTSDPIALIAAVGDPMQPVVAGMAIAASQQSGVLLAGGTQMLAVYALAGAIAHTQGLWWQPDQIVVGTTRWVADDPTSDTVGLAAAISQALPFLPMPTLLATQLSFATSRYPQLRIYEQGFVKEGVGAGGCAIAASLYRHWRSADVVQAIEQLLATMNLQPDPMSMRGGCMANELLSSEHSS